MKNKMIKNDEIVISSKVMEQISNTIARCEPETGGLLGSTDGGKTVDVFYFDNTATTSGVTYSPNVEALNNVIKEWNENNIIMVGVIHSHPWGCTEPSSGDYTYASRIIDAMNLVDDQLFTPIVQVNKKLNGEFQLYSYTHKREVIMHRTPFVIKQELLNDDSRINKKLDKLSKNRFEKIKDLYPLDVMARKHLVVIGAGGARDYILNLARSGVGKFTLFEGDVVEAKNIATQGVFADEIGKPKVECIRDAVLKINPRAQVNIVNTYLDDKITDDDFVKTIGKDIKQNAKDVIIAGCTDNFRSQARCSNLALKYGCPYIAAQLYEGGLAAEIYFSYPGVTNSSCPRCAMSSRYDAYLKNGYKKAGTSTGAPIFATERVNSTKGFITLMLMLYHEDENCIYNTMLDKVADRNFVMIRMSPFLQDKLGVGVFSEYDNNDFNFFDETIWIRQSPNDGNNGYEVCPLCQGNGNLRDLINKIEDTRMIV